MNLKQIVQEIVFLFDRESGQRSGRSGWIGPGLVVIAVLAWLAYELLRSGWT